jgi:hypothetical protein
MSEDRQLNAHLTQLPREFVNRLTKPFVRFLRIEAADSVCRQATPAYAQYPHGTIVAGFQHL